MNLGWKKWREKHSIVPWLKKINNSSKSNNYFKTDLGVQLYRNKCFSFSLLGGEITCAASNYSNFRRKLCRYYWLMTDKLWLTVSINLVPMPETTGVICAWKVNHISAFEPKLIYDVKTIADSLDLLSAVIPGFCNCLLVLALERSHGMLFLCLCPKVTYLNLCGIRN